MRAVPATLALLAFALAACARDPQGGNMRVTSSAFAANQPIPVQFSCDGQDVNPPLAFDSVPAAAKSLALVVDDPDAPGHTWVHWTIWNIDPKTREIAQGAVPQGAVQGRNDFDKTGWGGPCPPSGSAHHYRFKVFALGDRLDLAEGAREKDLRKAMHGKILDQGELIGTYTRKK